MENKRLHLEMIQNTISRMANNSFHLKEWTVTLLVGIFVLLDDSSDILYFCLVFIPIISFWCLDAYYLKQERLFRNYFDVVRSVENSDIDFSMNITKKQGYKNSNELSYCCCLFSRTEVVFYAPLCGISIIVIMLRYLTCL